MISGHLLTGLAILSAVTSQTDASESVKKRESEVADLNGTNQKHNAIEPRILNQLNKTGSLLTARSNLVGGLFGSPEIPPLPVSIEVREGSSLVGEVGRPALVTFEITSNLPRSTLFSFGVTDTANYRSSDFATPPQAQISFGNTVQTSVRLLPGRVGANPSILTFVVSWRDDYNGRSEVRKKAYFYVGTQDYDGYRPDIWYEFDGDCSGSVSPKNCDAKTWKAIVNFQDPDSGLLSITSDPVGLILDKEFIVGTKEAIRGYYSSSCCQTKVDISAKDILGNVRVKYIDIEKRWLSVGDISAIVLGCILFFLIVAVAVWLIVRCCRRRKTTLNIYPSSQSRREMNS
ncbi:Hypothetical protein NTJ_14872 [Nesidiocoris tenuis]|uniref:Uncharacterized protein n=1 Tax=Nesidiocoris tenuis TaxID=355587 RepID=A0ABN7BCS4_9HEMI|nr:Hypothetical protein NTJ_14872 [Nesidiocoris tenuis]